MKGAIEVEKYLWEIRADLGEMRAALEGELAAASLADLSRRPAEGAWSAADALRHAHQTNGLYLDRIEELVGAGGGGGADAGRATTGVGTARRAATHYRPGLLGGPFALSQGPDKPRRFKTVKPFVPPPDPGAATVVGDLLDQQDRLDAAIEAASRADLTVRLASPASKFLRFRLGDVLLLLSRHQLRHLGQARRALGSTLSNE